jgi:hypothetical protein
LLEAKVDALVNAVNVVGVMGAGIALQFRERYPEMFKAYARACKSGEECERLRNLDTGDLRERCAQFVKENEKAHPGLPESLNDRAADIWEPLLAVVELAGGTWPEKARLAADGLTGNAQSRSEIGSLLFDIFGGFAVRGPEKLLSRDLVARLNRMRERPWMDLPGLRFVDGGKRVEVTELWLSRQLRPYGVRPKNMRVGEQVGKGYAHEEMIDVFRRYVPRAEVEAFKAEAINLKPSV